jgi:hypothetical protein
MPYSSVIESATGEHTMNTAARTDYAAQMALFLIEKTGTVFGEWMGRMSAADQRALFGRFLGKGRIIINGADETLCMRIKCCFGLDYADEKQTNWRDL